MSLIALAEAIDHLVATGQAYIAESEGAATASNLSVAHAGELIALCGSLGWRTQLFDSADGLWEEGELDANFQPFRLVIDKPATADNTLQLLTNHAFSAWLLGGHPAATWQIARFECTVIAGTRVIGPWGENQVPVISSSTKSPRALVKEFRSERKVPDDVRPWLAAEPLPEHFDHPATQVWVRAASSALISCLPDEIDAENGALKFRGPPRLALPKFDIATDPLDIKTYSTLLAVVAWVFENEREAEMRHILLAAELARSGAAAQSTGIFLQKNLLHAWESAKVAYQMALAETGRDTLKVLSDLRKAVTEETAKLSDMGRQLTASVAAAVATGIGLIAARAATNASAVLIALVMGVVALYVATVITSGLQFMSLQRQLRADWQHRLYRFLPTDDYDRMVVQPTRRAERAFAWTARLGGATVALLTVICVWLAFGQEDSVPTSDQLPTSNAITTKSSSSDLVNAEPAPIKEDAASPQQSDDTPTVAPAAATKQQPAPETSKAKTPLPHTVPQSAR